MKSIRLSHRAVVGAATMAAGLVVLLLGLAVVALRAPGEGPGPTAENTRLRSEVQSMEGEIAALDQRLETLLQTEEELRIVADLPPVPVEIQAVGVGGPGYPTFDEASSVLDRRVATAATSLDLLMRRSALVASGMDDVRESIAAKKAKFEATPSIWPASGFLSSTFSRNRRHPIFHDVRPHYGIDISARRGNPIVATAAGKVVQAGWENGHGNYVEIDHGHGVRTTYSHASRVLVRSGQQVTRGQAVALIGSTGFSVAPHVHYEVHENGRPVDPLKYIFPDAIAD